MPKPPVRRTKGSPLTDADICRRNGWRKGTRLVGVEDGKRDEIRITAIGERDILAHWDGDEYEVLTSLTIRNWSRA